MSLHQAGSSYDLLYNYLQNLSKVTLRRQQEHRDYQD
jgi:hypothetical protein